METILLPDLITELPRAVRMQRLVCYLREQFHCGAVAILQLKDDALQPVAVDGLARETLGRRFNVADHPRLAAILASREAICFDHDTSLPDPYDGLLDDQPGMPLPVHDCMGVSLWLEGVLWGALTLDALQAGTFNSDALEQLNHHRLWVEASVRVSRLEEEYRRLLQMGGDYGSGNPSPEGEILGRATVIQVLLQEISVVADTDLPVLLMGETGVGKERFARRLHVLSRRSSAPLVHVNCAALPETLAESELFGHIRGAFSGASNDRAGRFEAAQGGTLFLDEVGELPLSVQAKLLRTLQNGEIQRLGEDHPRRVDVRIIAATNRHLRDSVREGSFRADLYHRLSVYPIVIPPLRERGTDVLLLAGHFLELNRARLGVRSLRLSTDAEEALCRYSWPGNIRELEHVISRAALKAISRGADRRDIITLPAELLDLDTVPLTGASRQVGTALASAHLPASASGKSSELPLRTQMEILQRHAIEKALHQHQHNQACAARSLGLDPSNLRKLMQRLSIAANPEQRRQ